MPYNKMGTQKHNDLPTGFLTCFSLNAGTRDGVLMKRGRDNGQFLSRRFVLSEREGTLKYYTKFDVSFSHSTLQNEQTQQEGRMMSYIPTIGMLQ